MDSVVVRDLLPLLDAPLGHHEDLVAVGVDAEGVGLTGVVQEQQGWEHGTAHLNITVHEN
jgi:hypothetical protein